MVSGVALIWACLDELGRTYVFLCGQLVAQWGLVPPRVVSLMRPVIGRLVFGVMGVTGPHPTLSLIIGRASPGSFQQ